MTSKNETAGEFEKVTKFALAELAYFQQTQSTLVEVRAKNGNVLFIKDWRIQVLDQDQVICVKSLRDPVEFHSKTCAIIYVVNELRKNIVNTIKIKELDDQIYRFRTQLDLLRIKIQRQRKVGYNDRFCLLNDRYSDTAARLNDTIAKIKKYCNLTKYNKGIKL